MTRSLIISRIAILIVILIVPHVSHAWNIVCGISISSFIASDESDEQRMKAYNDIGQIKWEADAHALRGIAFYYLAISELQRLEIQENDRVDIPQSLWQKDMLSTDQAVIFFSQSAAEFNQALEIANEYKLGDENGLGLLQKLHGGVAAFHDTMNSKNILPDLSELQNTASVIGEYVQHGVELSNMHLEFGLLGHGKGGVPYSTVK